MKLTPMRYKDYVWPHNPETYRISYQRETALHKVPFGRYFLQDMGMSRRVMRGEGVFSGPGAYDEFKRLASVFYDEGPGPLVHPVWMATSAFFVGLSLAQEPREDYVRYTFEFWEDFTGYGTGTAAAGGSAGAGESAVSVEKAYHAVIQGDTLWAIANANGTTVAALVRLNPEIKNPNLIRPGEKIRVK